MPTTSYDRDEIPRALVEPDRLELPDTARLVATFPLNGRPHTGYAVHIVDEQTDRARYMLEDRSFGHLITEYPTIGAAIARALSGSGWGSHKVAEMPQ